MSSYCKNMATFTPLGYFNKHKPLFSEEWCVYDRILIFSKTNKKESHFVFYKEDNFTTKWYRVWMISIITFLITIWLGEGHTINEPWVPNYYHNHIWCPNLQKPDFCSFSLRDLHYFMRKFFI